MTLSYDKGDVLRVQGQYLDLNNVAVDPIVVKFSVKTPSGLITTYTYLTDAQLVRSAAGTYSVDVHLNESGTWFVRHFATGTGEAAAEKQYFVRVSAFP